MSQTITHRTRFARASAVAGFQHLDAGTSFRAARYPLRTRNPFATFVVNAFCAAVCALMVAGEVDPDELFEQYDLKLRSYEDRLTLFTVATLPSIVALAAVYIGFQGVQSIRAALSL